VDECVCRESQRELEEHHCKIQAFSIVNITEQFFLHYSVLYACLCVFHIYVVNVYCSCAFCRSSFDFRLKVFEASYQEGVTER
jgi:hypothetical protein